MSAKWTVSRYPALFLTVVTFLGSSARTSGARIMIPTSTGVPSACVFSATDTLTYASSGLRRLVVLGIPGSVHIRGNTAQATVVIRGIRCGSNEAILARLKPQVKQESDSLSIDIATLNDLFKPNEGSVASLNLTIDMPADMEVRVSDARGAVEVTNAGKADVQAVIGGVRIDSVSGNVFAAANAGDVWVQHAAGDLEVSARAGDIDVRGVGKQVLVGHGQVGRCTIHDVKGDVTIGVGHVGDIVVGDVGGNLKVEKVVRGRVLYSHVAGSVSTGAH